MPHLDMYTHVRNHQLLPGHLARATRSGSRIVILQMWSKSNSGRIESAVEPLDCSN